MTISRPISGWLTPEDARRAAAMIRVRAIDQIVAETAIAAGLRASDLHGRNRSARIVEARDLACYVAYQHGFSYPKIGRALNRDHSTIMAAVRRERRRRGEA